MMIPADVFGVIISGNVGATMEYGLARIGSVIVKSALPLFSIIITVSLGCTLHESVMPKSALVNDCIMLVCSLKPRKLSEANALQLEV